MLQPKTVHYPSGFPMPQTPPVFICSSPGPDPYESNDNLYEELDQPDSQSDMSHNDSHRTLPHTTGVASAAAADRMSDNLNSSADTASVTDEIVNSNEIATSSSNTNTTTMNGMCNRNMTVGSSSGVVNENEVERRNRINVQMSNTAFSVATIFRDRNNMRFSRQQNHPTTATTTGTSTRANANYYAPSHNMTMNINGMSNNRVNISDSNCQFLTNPRAMHCWGSTAQYEPVLPSIYNSQCLPSNNYHHHHHHNQSSAGEQQHFATMRNFNTLRSPHHISQNTINSRKNLWSWFRRVRT